MTLTEQQITEFRATDYHDQILYALRYAANGKGKTAEEVTGLILKYCGAGACEYPDIHCRLEDMARRNMIRKSRNGRYSV